MANDEIWVDEFTTSERFSTVDDDAASRGTGDYRDYVYPADQEAFARYREMTVRAFSADRLSSAMMQDVLANWDRLYAAPFVGVTTDGKVRRSLYPLEALPAGEAAPTEEMTAAAMALIATLHPEQRERISFDIGAPEWRAWSNPEIIVHEIGLRLEDLAVYQRDAAMKLIEASLSPDGFCTVVSLMRLNRFLGEIVNLPSVLNEFSYQFAVFGEPSLEKPWGWQLFGHHIAINVLVVGNQIVMSPVFLGAEPNRGADVAGGAVMFLRRAQLALGLVNGLTLEQRERVTLYTSVRAGNMPVDRIQPIDERHLAGAFQDNRVIPYEGLCASDLDAEQRARLMALVSEHLSLLPPGPALARLREVSRFLDETWVCWIGGTTDESPFYFRIQSPVLLIEFDHHAGVWLSNQFPATFHVHTTMRTPNGNDYGKSLILQYQALHGEVAG
jgi:hypothetical protein